MYGAHLLSSAASGVCCLVFSCELINERLSRWCHSKQGIQKWAGSLLIYQSLGNRFQIPTTAVSGIFMDPLLCSVELPSHSCRHIWLAEGWIECLHFRIPCFCCSICGSLDRHSQKLLSKPVKHEQSCGQQLSHGLQQWPQHPVLTWPQERDHFKVLK